MRTAKGDMWREGDRSYMRTCERCGRRIRVRLDGKLAKHKYRSTYNYRLVRCKGSEQEVY